MHIAGTLGGTTVRETSDIEALGRALVAGFEGSGTEPPPPDLAGPLALALTERAQAAWPGFSVDPYAFLAWVARCMTEALLPQALEHLAVEDLYLAYACSCGDRAALDAFTRDCEGELRAVSAKLRVAPAAYDEIRQGIWQKLFVGSESAPAKITGYRGRGRLQHWFRAVAGRSVLDALRREKGAAGPATPTCVEDLHVLAPDSDPELAYLKRLYRSEFRAAFGGALQALDSHQRTVLRGYYVLGMNVKQLATALGLHRTTAARHLEQARVDLLRGTHERLRERLRVSGRELESVMRLIESQLSVSLSRLLG